MTDAEITRATIDSSYDQYQIVDLRYEDRPARVLFSGARRAAQSGIALDDNPDLLFDYNQRFLELANAVYPQKVLVLGGGAYTLPMALVAALPDAQITVVELDEALLEIAKTHFGLLENERLHCYFGDGRKFIESSGDAYDLIIIDVFSELRIPDQFLTLEFVQAVQCRLNPGGNVVLNIIASYKGMNDGLIKSQIAAYQQEFDRVDVYPAAHGLTSWLPQNLVLFAQTKPTEDYKHYVRFAAIDMPASDATNIRYDH